MPIIILLGMWAGSAAAQTPAISAEMPVPSATLLEWLHSGDPRLVAWAADFARRRQDRAVLDAIPAVLQTWVLPADGGAGTDGRGYWKAALGMVDAVVETRGSLPRGVLLEIAPQMPAQALLLVKQMPEADGRSLLSGWAGITAGDWGRLVLARVSTMLLADRPQGVEMYGPRSDGTVLPLPLVDSVLGESTLRLEVTVSLTGTARELLTGAGCGDGGSGGITAGWPRVYEYSLEERPSTSDGVAVVDLDGDSIVARRRAEDQGWGSCSGVAYLNPDTRHRLLAHWLGVPPKGMAWQPVEAAGFAWTNRAEYQRWLGVTVAAWQEKLRNTAAELKQRGLATGEQVPQLVVVVHCEMTPCPLDAADGSH